jgi:deazaflavin-dependent oxidoreductase (nitroreductase family)
MFMQELARIETEFYRGVNSFVEPLVRAGVGSPVFWPVGAIVLEVTGRNTGQSFNVPLLAARVGELFVVSTYRRRSEWVKNLAASSEVRYWLGGRRHDATAFVLTPDHASSSMEGLPPRAACLAAVLRPQSRLFGSSFAILMPRN